MTWSSHEVPGGVVELFQPSSPRSSTGLLFLPGQSLKTLAASNTWTRLLEQSGLRAACPVSGNGWWLDAS
ncbi:MAG TPA: hypothetical protein DCE43_12325, partial [Planctomycetaceae bacterium]|nr:hypothetical protein [Planctomycetaceae bacterium]